MKLTNTIRDAFVRSAMDDVPSEDFTEQARSLITADAVAALPPKVRAIWNDKTLRHLVATFYCHQHREFTAQVPGCNELKLSPETMTALDALGGKHVAQITSRRALKDKLRSVAYSVNTRKALVDALPEFEKYLPKDEAAACRTLPVVANVVSEFVKAGWPKGAGKKTKATA